MEPMDIGDVVVKMSVKVENESAKQLLEIRDTAQRLADLITLFCKEFKGSVELDT